MARKRLLPRGAYPLSCPPLPSWGSCNTFCPSEFQNDIACSLSAQFEVRPKRGRESFLAASHPKRRPIPPRLCTAPQAAGAPRSPDGLKRGRESFPGKDSRPLFIPFYSRAGCSGTSAMTRLTSARSNRKWRLARKRSNSTGGSPAPSKHFSGVPDRKKTGREKGPGAFLAVSYPTVSFLGRPRGLSVHSSPRRSAVRSCQRSPPKGRPRCTLRRSASSSCRVTASLT